MHETFLFDRGKRLARVLLRALGGGASIRSAAASRLTPARPDLRARRGAMEIGPAAPVAGSAPGDNLLRKFDEAGAAFDRLAIAARAVDCLAAAARVPAGGAVTGRTDERQHGR